MTDSRFLRSFWPQSDDEDFLVVARKRAIILFGVTGGLITLLSGIRHVAANGGDVSLKDFILVIVCPLLFFLTPWIVTRAKNTNFVFGIFIAYGYLLVWANHLNGGGIVSHASFFLVALSCLVAVNYGWRGAGIAIVLTITHFVVLIMFRENFTLVVDLAPPGAIDIWLASGLIFILLLTSLGGAACQSETRRAAEKLAEARAAAEMASTAKSEFLANMSHEIRTPMNGVLGMAELLKQTELTERQKIFAETIYGSGSALLTIINDILDYSKIEAGKMELDPAPFFLKNAVEDVAALLGVTARAKSIELMLRVQPGMPECVIGDVSRIRQAVTNLVGNAIKFTHEGHVLISVAGAVDGEAANVRISVQDTGIGIAADKIDDVFGQFNQAESSTTRKYGGTGLGLSITQSLVEAMGGSVRVESTLGKGSIFMIDLVLPVAETPESVANPAVSLQGEVILVVDDNAINRQILEEQLTVWGAAAVSADSAAVALEILRGQADKQAPIRIALIDYHMPEMDGLQLTEAMRDDPACADVKTVVLSSVDDDAVSAQFRALGVANVMAKPVKSSLLKQTVCETLGLCDASLESGAPKEVITPVKAGAHDETSEVEFSLKPKILIAEDNEVNRLVIRHMIDMNAFHLAFAENGKIAYSMACQSDYDIILMDISMPEMDGIEATKAIRAHEQSNGLAETTIIAMTAHAMAGDRERFLGAGMDDYIQKPVNKKSIDEMLRKCLDDARVSALKAG